MFGIECGVTAKNFGAETLPAKVSLSSAALNKRVIHSINNHFHKPLIGRNCHPGCLTDFRCQPAERFR